MAEFILKALVKAKGLEEGFHIESAAVSAEEIGNPIYPPAKRCLSQHGVWFDPDKRDRQVTRAVTSPTHGTPVISRPLSRTCWRDAKRCWE